MLPTFWTEEELDLANGTTLRPAIEAKMKSLYREYEYFRQATRNVPWCRDVWWNEVDGVLDFDDWKQVDAMYRSRALELPGIGDCMVLYIDFANHASGEKTNAIYQADHNGNCLLTFDGEKSVQSGDEVNITYGDDKGACEMIFSYGFLEAGMENAATLFLDIAIPNDDPLKRAKQAFATCAPGVRLNLKLGQVVWESKYIWLLVVNEEDGLEFSVVQTTIGERELQAHWNGENISNSSEIESKLRSHRLWDVFCLRATVMLGGRVEEQLEALDSTVEMHQSTSIQDSHVRERPRKLIAELALLERNLLKTCSEYIARRYEELVQSKIVQEFLQVQQLNDGSTQEDFS